MPSLFDASDRASILRRLDALAPDATRRWGTMPTGRMLTHLADPLRYALGERSIGNVRGILTIPLVQWLTVVVLPWPHGLIRASPLLLSTDPTSFEEDRATLRSLILRFAEIDGTPAPHPMLGALSRRLWDHLSVRHLDYHLRQFGA